MQLPLSLEELFLSFPFLPQEDGVPSAPMLEHAPLRCCCGPVLLATLLPKSGPPATLELAPAPGPGFSLLSTHLPSYHLRYLTLAWRINSEQCRQSGELWAGWGLDGQRRNRAAPLPVSPSPTPSPSPSLYGFSKEQVVLV